MDAILLSAVSRHLERDLVGHSFLVGERIGHLDYLLRMDCATFPRLRMSVRPPHAFFYRPAPSQRFHRQAPDPFVSLLGRELSEASLTGLQAREGDRVLELTWRAKDGHPRFLVAELLGKSSNLLLLDEQRTILGYAREMASAFRAPRVGDPYRFPSPREGFEDITWDPSRATSYIDRFAGNDIERNRAAASFLRGLSPPLAESVESDPAWSSDPMPFSSKIRRASSLLADAI